MNRHNLLVVAGVLLSALFLALALRGIDVETLWSVARQADFTWLVAVAFLIIVGLGLRALRWRGVVTADDVSFQLAFAANSIGYLGNLFLPARAGELFRSVILGRHSGLGTSHVLAASLSERVLDALTLVGIVLLSLGTLVSPDIRQAAIPVAIICVVSLAGLSALAHRPELVLACLSRLPLPAALLTRLGPLVSRFLGGLAALRSGAQLRQFGLYTAIIWALDGVWRLPWHKRFSWRLLGLKPCSCWRRWGCPAPFPPPRDILGCTNL